MRHNLPKRLRRNQKVDIFIEDDEGNLKFECRARLIEKLDTWYRPEPFPYEELSKTRVINAIKEKWRVEVIDTNPFEDGVERVRWVMKFFSEGIIKIRDIPPKTAEENFLNDDNYLI